MNGHTVITAEFQHALELIKAGISNPTTLRRFGNRPKRNPNPGFQYCMAGRGELVTGREVMDLRSGTGVFTFPGEAFSIGKHDRAFTRFFSYFRHSRENVLFRREVLEALENNRLIKPSNHEGILVLCRRILENTVGRRDSYSPMIASGQFMTMLGVLLRQNATKGVADSAWANPEKWAKIDNTRAYIEEHFNERLDLRYLATRAGFSENHFVRVFREMTSFAPHQYLLHRRIEYAKMRLRERIAPIKEIADETGFVEVSHFCRTFKKWTGVTPAAYRRRGPGSSPESAGEGNP